MYATYSVHLSTATQKLVDKFKNGAPPPINQQRPLLPQYVHDIFEKIDIDNNLNKDKGPVAIIDFQPDFRYPLYVTQSMIIQLYHEFDAKSTSIVTLPSLTAYLLALFYGLALLNDTASLRHEQSHHAREFCQNPSRNNLLIALSKAKVPQCMHAIFDTLQGCYIPGKTRMLVLYTLACAHFGVDFGRLIPCSIFTYAHNLIATQPTNQHPSVTQHLWLTSPVTAQPHATSVAHYFGQHIQQRNTDNWLYTMTQTMFNTTLSRFQVTRSNMQRLNTFAMPTAANQDEINPYIFALSASADNVTMMTTLINNMSLAIEQTLNGTQPLASYTKIQANQTSILNHYYTTPGTPTWHNLRLQPPAKVDNYFPDAISSISRAVTQLKFLQVPDVAKNVNVIPLDCSDRIPPWLYLGPCTDTTPEQAAAFRTVNPIIFDPDIHQRPRARHMCPFAPSPEEIRTNLVLGKTIESFEIDGFSIRQPDPDNTIEVENGSFLESAIPFTNCHPGTYTRDNAFVAQRREHTDLQIPVQIDMIRLDINRLPIIGGHIYGPPDGQLITGFDNDIVIEHARYASSNPSYNIIDSDATSPVGTTNMKPFYAWSCYRYYNRNQHRNVPQLNRTYMLMNLRTLFGTNVLLSETPHIADICQTK